MGDLTTLDSVKAYIGGTIPPSVDPLLQALITAASAYVVSFCGRDFGSTVQTEYYNGTGNSRQMLRKTPVTAVSDVVVNGQTWIAAEWPQSGFAFDELGLIATGAFNDNFFPRGTRNVKVTYTAGYAAVPADLSQAVNEMVADKYARRANIGISARQIAQETITYTSGDVPKSAASVLSFYQSAAFGL